MPTWIPSWRPTRTRTSTPRALRNLTAITAGDVATVSSGTVAGTSIASDSADPSVTRRVALSALIGRFALMACAVVAAFAASATESADVVATCSAAALAIVIGVLRWAPPLDGDDARPVGAPALLLPAAVALELFALSWGHPGWAPVLIGPIATAGILAGYLATFGFRAAFLLRRVVLLSVLLWAPIAAVADRVVRSSIDPLSDLIYRRLASVDAVAVAEHPWRLFTAMTDRAALVAVTAVLLGTAISRRRLTARGVVEMSIAVVLAMVVHHATLLAAPIDRYDRPRWVGFVAGPHYEVLLGTGAAVLAAWMARRTASRDGRAQNPSVSAARDRDPVLFAVTASDDASALVRACAISIPLVLVVALVAREFVS
jgi:hypothetical protein